MDRQLLDVDAKPAVRGDFRWRDLGRLIALARPYRNKLIVGLAATVLFAVLHTVSIATAFPVCKLLLEEEGIRGWVDRMIAGQRVGLAFNQPTDATSIVVAKISADHSSADHSSADDETDSPAIKPGDVIFDVRNRPIAELLHELAELRADAKIAVLVESRGERKEVELTGFDPDFMGSLSQGALRWGASLMPAGANTAEGKLAALIRILGALIVIVVLGNICRYVGEICITTAILRAMMDVRGQLYERTLYLPMSFFAGKQTSDLVTRFVQDIQEIQRGLLTLFGKFIREPMRAVLILGMAFTLDWRLTLTMIVVAPITVGLFWAVGRSVKKANRKLLEGYGRMIGALTTSLQNLRVVKVYTAEDHERARLASVDRRMFEQQVKLAKLQAFVSPTIETLAVMAGSLVTVWLASRVLNEELSISKFVGLGVVLGMLFDPLRKLTDVYVRVKRSTAGAERVFQVLDEPIETDGDAAHTQVKPLQKSIDFSDVTFTYPGAATPALVDINLSLRKGETVALVGPNGCGKTTLVSMLPRLLVPDSGEIRYDGVALGTVNLRSLRNQIGVVSQDAIVFAGTPVENIAYGQREPDRDRVEDAARRAYADEFIRNIPGGYEADLGERGTTLSGGQRQRLAIARAIYRDAPILIFDEATSQIDSESERKIQEALQEFARDRTTIIIAHRLSTIQFASRIIVMDAGRIIDSGAHKELFDRCTLYRNLCQTQFMGERV